MGVLLIMPMWLLFIHNGKYRPTRLVVELETSASVPSSSIRSDQNGNYPLTGTVTVYELPHTYVSHSEVLQCRHIHMYADIGEFWDL